MKIEIEGQRLDTSTIKEFFIYIVWKPNEEFVIFDIIHHDDEQMVFKSYLKGSEIQKIVAQLKEEGIEVVFGMLE